MTRSPRICSSCSWPCSALLSAQLRGGRRIRRRPVPTRAVVGADGGNGAHAHTALRDAGRQAGTARHSGPRRSDGRCEAPAAASGRSGSRPPTADAPGLRLPATDLPPPRAADATFRTRSRSTRPPPGAEPRVFDMTDFPPSAAGSCCSAAPASPRSPLPAAPPPAPPAVADETTPHRRPTCSPCMRRCPNEQFPLRPPTSTWSDRSTGGRWSTIRPASGRAPSSSIRPNRFLYLVRDDGKALRYGVGIGRDGFAWSGRGADRLQARMADLDAAVRDDRPPARARAVSPAAWRRASTTRSAPARSTSSRMGEDTLYRLHGNPDERSIGQAVSSAAACGCCNQDVIDLYERVPVGNADRGVAG